MTGLGNIEETRREKERKKCKLREFKALRERRVAVNID